MDRVRNKVLKYIKQQRRAISRGEEGWKEERRVIRRREDRREGRVNKIRSSVTDKKTPKTLLKERRNEIVFFCWNQVKDSV